MHHPNGVFTDPAGMRESIESGKRVTSVQRESVCKAGIVMAVRVKKQRSSEDPGAVERVCYTATAGVQEGEQQTGKVIPLPAEANGDWTVGDVRAAGK